MQCSVKNFSPIDDSNYNIVFNINNGGQPTEGTSVIYDPTYIKSGMWFSNKPGGLAWKIINIISTNTASATCIIQDVDNYNKIIYNNNDLPDPIIGNGYIYNLSNDGLPNLTPVIASSNFDYAWITNLIGRFRSRNLYQYNIPITQANHNFNIGDFIYLDMSGIYHKISASNSSLYDAIGIVTTNNGNYYLTGGSSILVEEPQYFSYMPLGKYLPTLSGISSAAIGSKIYLDLSGNLTTNINSYYSRPKYIKINTNNDVILLNNSYGSYINYSKITIYCGICGNITKYIADNSISDISSYIMPTILSNNLNIITNSNFKLPTSILIHGRTFINNDPTNYIPSILQSNNLNIQFYKDISNNLNLNISAYSYSNLVTLLGINNPPDNNNNYIASEIILNH
jgi:hypothetical protein